MTRSVGGRAPPGIERGPGGGLAENDIGNGNTHPLSEIAGGRNYSPLADLRFRLVSRWPVMAIRPTASELRHAEAATWGPRPNAERRTAQRPRTIALIAWRPLVKGALRGFAAVELPIGLKLIDCPVLLSNGKAWANLPSKPVLDRDGRQKTDANGKQAFTAILEWRSRELRDRFSEVVIAALRQMYPSALDEAGS